MRVQRFSVRKNAAKLPGIKAAIAANPDLYETLCDLSGGPDMGAAALETILASGGNRITIIR